MGSNKAHQAGDTNRSSPRKRSSSEALEDVSQRGELPDKRVKTSSGSRAVETSELQRAKSLEPETTPWSPNSKKRGSSEAGLDGDEECRATSEPTPQASLAGLPYEIKQMIFREALVADAPIQPIDPRNKKRKGLPVPQRIRCHKRRRLNLGVGLLGTAGWAYDLGADVLYKENQIDLSETEAGAMTIRKFRRQFSEQTKAKIQHVVVSARIIKPPSDNALTPKRKDRIRRVRKAADMEFGARLADGSLVANIARTFPMLQSLEVRLNLREWKPAGKVHWDLFGGEFQGLTVARSQYPGDMTFSNVSRYDPSGELVT